MEWVSLTTISHTGPLTTLRIDRARQICNLHRGKYIFYPPFSLNCRAKLCKFTVPLKELLENAYSAHEEDISDFIQLLRKSDVFQVPSCDLSTQKDTDIKDSSTQTTIIPYPEQTTSNVKQIVVLPVHRKICCNKHMVLRDIEIFLASS